MSADEAKAIERTDQTPEPRGKYRRHTVALVFSLSPGGSLIGDGQLAPVIHNVSCVFIIKRL